MSEDLMQQIEEFAAKTNSKIARTQKGEIIVEIDKSKLRDFVSRLVAEAHIFHLSTISGIDLGQNLGMVYHFWKDRNMLHLKTYVPKDKPVAESIVDILPGAVLYEMEVHDMFGVTFAGNPWMDRKLLLPDNWPADLPPPLLKDSKPAEIRKRLNLEVERF